jgi:RNA polymerase sigma-70 factor (ECF subfamily)
MTDADRFEAFVRAHQDMVYATAVRLLGRAAEAEDVAQTVFLKAFERFDTIGGSPSAAGWLKTVTRNECLNHLTRYRSRWRFFSELTGRGAPGDQDGPGTRYAPLPAGESPARELEEADERRQLESALQALPDRQRVPLVLFHFEEASYEEIASLLGVSVAKVKTDIHRGREALRARLVESASRRATDAPAGRGRTVPHGSR